MNKVPDPVQPEPPAPIDPAAADRLKRKAEKKKQAKILKELSRDRNAKAVVRTKNRAMR